MIPGWCICGVWGRAGKGCISRFETAYLILLSTRAVFLQYTRDIVLCILRREVSSAACSFPSSCCGLSKLFRQRVLSKRYDSGGSRPLASREGAQWYHDLLRELSSGLVRWWEKAFQTSCRRRNLGTSPSCLSADRRTSACSTRIPTRYRNSVGGRQFFFLTAIPRKTGTLGEP